MRELMDDGDTGDAQVDEAVRTLDALDAMPVHEHAGVVERVHQVLQDRLAGEPDVALDDEPDEPVDEPGTDVAEVVPAGDPDAVTHESGGAGDRAYGAAPGEAGDPDGSGDGHSDGEG